MKLPSIGTRVTVERHGERFEATVVGLGLGHIEVSRVEATDDDTEWVYPLDLVGFDPDW